MPDLFGSAHDYSRPAKVRAERKLTARETVALQVVEASAKIGASEHEVETTMELTGAQAHQALHKLWLSGAIARRYTGTQYRYFAHGKEPAD